MNLKKWVTLGTLLPTLGRFLMGVGQLGLQAVEVFLLGRVENNCVALIVGFSGTLHCMKLSSAEAFRHATSAFSKVSCRMPSALGQDCRRMKVFGESFLHRPFHDVITDLRGEGKSSVTLCQPFVNPYITRDKIQLEVDLPCCQL